MSDSNEQLLAAPLPPEGILITAPWELIHDSPFQYRKTHNETKLQELADNIRETGGIHQPILARRRFPHPLITEYNAADGLEIVAGHRRKLAGMKAGLAGAPLLVKDLNDEQARRIQITENLQREDVHAIEEAEGFQELIDHHNETADRIAEQFGKSRSYVYGRLKLLALCPEVRKACLAGEIQTEVGLLIARLRTLKLQEKALGYIKGKYIDLKDGGKRSFRSVRDLLNERFALDLKDAIFDVEEEMLLPEAGNCIRCTKRSGNAPEYEDIATADKRNHYSRNHVGPDVCTDPDCFDAKKKAHLKREAQKLADKGKTVVDGNKARQAIDAYGKLKDGYVPLADVREALKAAKDKAITTLHIQDPRTGKVVQAVKRDDLVAAGVKRKQPEAKQSNPNEKYERERRESDRKALLESKARKETLLRVRARIREEGRSLFDLRLLARNVLDVMGYKCGRLLEELHGMEYEQLQASIDGMSANGLSCLMLDVVIAAEVQIDGWSLSAGRSPAKALMDAAAHYGIDVDQVRAEVSGVASTPPPAARAPGKAAAGAKKKTTAGPAKGKAAKTPIKTFDADAPIEPELSQEQTDDAGDAGGSAGQVDALEEADA